MVSTYGDFVGRNAIPSDGKDGPACNYLRRFASEQRDLSIPRIVKLRLPFPVPMRPSR